MFIRGLECGPLRVTEARARAVAGRPAEKAPAEAAVRARTQREAFDEGMVVTVSAFEGDIVVLGSDGVFDNLFIDEILGICDSFLPPSSAGTKFRPTDRNVFGEIAKQVVASAHAKTKAVNGIYAESPIGRGGKIDDTSVLIGEVVEWTPAHGEAWAKLRQQRWWRGLLTCGGTVPTCGEEISVADAEYEYGTGARVRNYPANPNASFSTYYGSAAGSFNSSGSFNSASAGSAANLYNRKESIEGPGEAGYPGGRPVRSRRRDRDEDDEEEDRKCCIM